MKSDKLESSLRNYGIVPVVHLANISEALRLAEVLIENNLPILEITLRTEAGIPAIRAISERFPELLIGVGTLRNPDQVTEARDSGAHFGVSPGANQAVISKSLELNFQIIPGAVTPTELEALLDIEIELVKFFPAEAAGGVKYLKALGAPYLQAKFMPTGGISLSNLSQYLEQDNVIACGGTWIATSDLLANSNFEQISNNVKEAMAVTANFTKSPERKK